MTFAPQLDIVSRHVEQARAAGARVLTGGGVAARTAAASTSRPCSSTSTTRWRA